MTDTLTLEDVNTRINAIPYNALGVDASEDEWIDAPQPDQVWECRDYTIAKAKALREAGWPINDMFVILCWIEPDGNPPKREYHAVLGARFNGDVYILDNRYPSIYLWNKPPYDYLWAHQQIPGTVTFRNASHGLV